MVHFGGPSIQIHIPRRIRHRIVLKVQIVLLGTTTRQHIRLSWQLLVLRIPFMLKSFTRPNITILVFQ